MEDTRITDDGAVIVTLHTAGYGSMRATDRDTGQVFTSTGWHPVDILAMQAIYTALVAQCPTWLSDDILDTLAFL